MNNPTSPKVTAAGASGALVTVVAWGAERFAGVEIPDGVQGALTVLVMVAAAYLVTDPMRAALVEIEVARDVDELEGEGRV